MALLSAHGCAGSWGFGGASGGEALVAGVPDVDPEAFRAAAEASVAPSAAGPVHVARSWRWRPQLARTLLVWIACRGAGQGRACVVGVGLPESADGGGVTVRRLAAEAVGWAVPQVGEQSADELVIAGVDGRGAWRQSLRFVAADNGGTIAVGRRLYTDGY